MNRLARMVLRLFPQELTTEERIELHEARIGSLEVRVDDLEDQKKEPPRDGSHARDRP